MFLTLLSSLCFFYTIVWNFEIYLINLKSERILLYAETIIFITISELCVYIYVLKEILTIKLKIRLKWIFTKVIEYISIKFEY